MGLLERRPILIAVAWPNGAGKSTLYSSHFEPSGLRFINSDEIAHRVKIDAYRAAEAADAIRRMLVDSDESFIFETVFSDPVGEELEFLKDAERRGYTVVLFFVGVDSPATSEERVSIRVAEGGLDVPREKLASHYKRTIQNLRLSLLELSNIRIYDNTDMRKPHRLVAVQESGVLIELHPPIPRWLKPLLPRR